MNVLIVQNYDSTGLGLVCQALNEAGATRDYRKPYLGETLPEDPSAHDAIVVLGGGQSAVDDHIHPYLPNLAVLMRRFADEGKAALGICLGSQILARAFGAKNLIGQAPEFGWQNIELTEDGKADPVLGAVPGAFPIFQWHDDTFTLPEGRYPLWRKMGRPPTRRSAWAALHTGYSSTSRRIAPWWKSGTPAFPMTLPAKTRIGLKSTRKKRNCTAPMQTLQASRLRGPG